MSKLVSMKVFCCTVNTLNFSATAEKLHMSCAMVSKHIAYLEHRLGIQLFNRTTRKVRLTEKGSLYYQRCHVILDELEQLESAIGETDSAISGALRLSLPMDFGIENIAPLVTPFLQLHPKMSLDMVYDDDFQNLIEGNFDLAIRVSHQLPDSTLIAKKIAATRAVLCASPEYLQRHGEILRVPDLALHNCIQFSHAPDKIIWRLAGEQGEESVRVRGNLHCNSGRAMLIASLAGLGVSMLPMFLAQPAIREGKLIQLLAQYQVLDLGVYAMYPSKQFLPTKVRSFIEFAEQQLSTENL